jgi:hypothetical protein
MREIIDIKSNQNVCAHTAADHGRRHRDRTVFDYVELATATTNFALMSSREYEGFAATVINAGPIV